MEYLKYHALGNDYLVSTSEHADFSENELTSEQVRKICHRNFGIGSDGILVGGKDDSGNCFTLKIYNPDGSTAEKSGNGLRILRVHSGIGNWLISQDLKSLHPEELSAHR